MESIDNILPQVIQYLSCFGYTLFLYNIIQVGHS